MRGTMVALLLLIITGNLGAQATAPPPSEATMKFVPGDPAVNGSFLKPYKNAWKVVYAFPGKEPVLVGTWTDELKEIEVNGHRLLERTQMADYAKYHVVTDYVNVFDPKTMLPVSQDFKRSDTGEWAHRDFNGSTVKFRRKASNQAEAKTGELNLASPIFDYNGGMFGVLLATLPLKDELKAIFPALSEDRDELEWVTARVGKPESTDAGTGKQVMAWPIDVDANYANKSHSTFWVTKDPPYVIKLVTIIPEGKWVTVTLSMI